METEQKEKCTWRMTDEYIGLWEGTCGAAWQFTNDGPQENNVNYCPQCGKQVVIRSEPYLGTNVAGDVTINGSDGQE